MQIVKYARKIVPYPIRMYLKIGIRTWQDYRKNYHKRFALPQAEISIHCPYSLEIQQPVMPGTTLQAKLNNIQLGINAVEKVIIYPNEIFSFWKIVGKTTAKKGYQKGRNLVNGEIQEDYGGGLCQLASIMYHLGLCAGLNIVERHHHSVDIYKEHERFTPLGADATVVFGFKDLRLENPYSFPLRFSFVLSEHLLIGQIQSEQAIEKQAIEFERKALPTQQMQVETRTDSQKVLAVSVYNLPIK
ncbi:MAG: VanW family protein [Bacteroidia bacterium]